MNALNSIANNRLWNKHGLKLAWLLAVLLFALILSSIGWTALNQTKSKRANYQPQEIAPISTARKPASKVNDIVSANLFGDPTPPAPVAKVAPKTTLNLTLEGVLWSSDNTFGRAIIVSGNKTAELYSIGEEIKGAGAKVEEIRDAEVILNRSGALESLPLNRLTDSSNRIVVNFPNDPADGIIEDYEKTESFLRDTQSLQTRTALNRQSNTIQRTEANNGNNQRVRRPNFSGLDKALEKMGDL